MDHDSLMRQIKSSSEYITGKKLADKFHQIKDSYGEIPEGAFLEWVVPQRIFHGIFLAMGYGYSYDLTFRKLKNGNDQYQLYVLDIPLREGAVQKILLLGDNHDS